MSLSLSSADPCPCCHRGSGTGTAQPPLGGQGALHRVNPHEFTGIPGLSANKTGSFLPFPASCWSLAGPCVSPGQGCPATGSQPCRDSTTLTPQMTLLCLFPPCRAPGAAGWSQAGCPREQPSSREPWGAAGQARLVSSSWQRPHGAGTRAGAPSTHGAVGSRHLCPSPAPVPGTAHFTGLFVGPALTGVTLDTWGWLCLTPACAEGPDPPKPQGQGEGVASSLGKHHPGKSVIHERMFSLGSGHVCCFLGTGIHSAQPC